MAQLIIAPVFTPGFCEVEDLTDTQRGEGGFGYDPIFFSSELGKSFGVATEEEKNSVSHRARAIEDLLAKLQGKQ